MNDPEFIMLRNRFLIAIIVALIFTVPLFFFFKNKFLIDESIINKIKKKENITLLIVKRNCNECEEYKKQLESSNVAYIKINKDKDKNYDLLLNDLNMSYTDITIPTIIYIENKKVIATLTNNKSAEEVSSFIKNYNLEGNRN